MVNHNDIVICVDNDDSDLILNKQYIVDDIDCDDYTIYITLVDCNTNYYCIDRFKTLNEIRNIKIWNIMNSKN